MLSTHIHIVWSARAEHGMAVAFLCYKKCQSYTERPARVVCRWDTYSLLQNFSLTLSSTSSSANYDEALLSANIVLDVLPTREHHRNMHNSRMAELLIEQAGDVHLTHSALHVLQPCRYIKNSKATGAFLVDNVEEHH